MEVFRGGRERPGGCRDVLATPALYFAIFLLVARFYF